MMILVVLLIEKKREAKLGQNKLDIDSEKTACRYIYILFIYFIYYCVEILLVIFNFF